MRKKLQGSTCKCWTATRYGELYVHVESINLTHERISVSVHFRANSWRQKWDKAEAVDLVASHLRRGEWASLLTMWLGDGQAERGKVLSSEYKLMIAAKEPWRLGSSIGVCKALIAFGKEAFIKLKEAAGVYGELLDLLKAHKWIYIKLATDDALWMIHKLKAEKRSIDRLREAYRQKTARSLRSSFSHAEGPRRGAVAVAGVMMSLHLVNGTGGSLRARRYVRTLGEAFTIAERLESVGLRPNVVRSGPKYLVYITTEDLLKLAEGDGDIRRAVALYLAEKAKNGTPRQKEIAEKTLRRYPFFLSHIASSKSTLLCVSRY